METQTQNIIKDSEQEFVVTNNTKIKPVAYFVGRERELEELRQRIEGKRQAILLSGMGGIGKTLICRKLFNEYLVKHANNEDCPFQHIGYIEYSGDMGSSLQKCLLYKQQEANQETAWQELARLADRIRLLQADREANQETAWQELAHFVHDGELLLQADREANQEVAWKKLADLAKNGQLLLFVDNVDKTIKEDPSLERLNSIPGPVVITSRLPEISDEFETYFIEPLSTEQCRELYENIRYKSSGGKVKPEEVPDLLYIIETLTGRHTITIDHLAHMARTKHWSVRKVREELQQKGFRVELEKDRKLANMQESYEALFKLSVVTEPEKNILEAFSVFPYIPLSAKICKQWLFEDAGSKEDDDILIGLYQKGWLQFDEDQEAYMMHPVFAKFIYNKYNPSAERHAGLIRACQDSIRIPTSNLILECQKYLPFVENIIFKLDLQKGREGVGLINIFAQLLMCSGEFKEAEKWYKEALEICQEIGEDNYDIAAIYDKQAELYTIDGEYEKAAELYEKSIRIRERTLGENHKDTAASYCGRATIYEYQLNFKKAEEFYIRSLKIYERAGEENQPEIATIFNNLAGMYRRKGRFDIAEKLHEKSLSIRKEALGEEHPHTALSYRNLAGVYLNTGRYREAEIFYEKSLSIFEMAVGENHPDTALTYNDLGAVYYCTRRFEKAVSYHLKAYKIDFVKYGSNHPVTNLFYENLRRAYFRWQKVIFNRDEKFEHWREEEMESIIMSAPLFAISTENERDFVVTHNANIESTANFIGRETELKELRYIIEKKCKSVLVSGVSGIGKTCICRKLFDEYLIKHSNSEDIPFKYIGFIQYCESMDSSIVNCLKYKKQADCELNLQEAWRELEYLASDGKLLLFVDNVTKSINEDPGLQRLGSLPGIVVLTSVLSGFSDEFETYYIGRLTTMQGIELYQKVRYNDNRHVIGPKETHDLEYIIDGLADAHTLTNNAKTVFLSYSRHDEDIANEIDNNLSKHSKIHVKRDIRDLGTWKSIRDFIKSIRQQDYAILIISDTYLRSQYCMFEVTEIMKESDYEGRIFLVVMEQRIYDPLIRSEYVKYWQKECDKLEASIRELNPENSANSIADLRRYKSIASSIGDFLGMVANRNNPDVHEIYKHIERAIFENI